MSYFHSFLISLLTHLIVLLLIFGRNGFIWEIRKPAKLDETHTPVVRRMRVDVLDLPDIERYFPPPQPRGRIQVETPKKKKPAPPKKPPEKVLTRKELLEKLRKEFKGNILQEGIDVMSAAVQPLSPAEEGDPYWQLLQDHIVEQWHVTSGLKAPDLVVVYQVYIGRDGHVIRADLIQRSARPEYDMFVRDFIENQLRIDIEIPIRHQQRLMRNGIAVIFDPE